LLALDDCLLYLEFEERRLRAFKLLANFSNLYLQHITFYFIFLIFKTLDV